MEYVIGVDLGTSAVKVLLVNQQGQVEAECSKEYPLYHDRTGYSEQDPDDWVKKTEAALQELVEQTGIRPATIKGLSFSGQMHGLVLVNEKGQPLRRAILWNDTRTTEECQDIEAAVGLDTFLAITKNRALEGFTLPKLLWVKKHEPDIYQQAHGFLLPKDYVRYQLTGDFAMEYSDAAGTLLLDIANQAWSTEIADKVGVDIQLCPPLVESQACVGTIMPEVSERTGLGPETRVFAGGADNACGAIGAGVLSEGKTMCSAGTSGVVLSYEAAGNLDFGGKVHYFNHAKSDAFYNMGVTLAAGYSLDWFRKTFAEDTSFSELFQKIAEVPVGSRGLLFTPYIVGERTPHADADIRGAFIGADASHMKWDFARAVVEGITFSLNESMNILKNSGKKITSVVSIGGGAKSNEWLQIQADIFNAPIVKLENEQGPGMGAAMIAAVGSDWFASLQDCADAFIKTEKVIEPREEHVSTYETLFAVYQDVYDQTKGLTHALKQFRG
ncbi:xylulokinase [Tuberibacillus sp. Marseille-P3662]|uniref:xylulokinase n=1 Tax=Tuberibacillus sp. Marseille-P3662 TaxID=1965358 RepID=UPI000A1CA267|nr:xylulokinase [Tuberibacillus sp. Marseille-P3662]